MKLIAASEVSALDGRISAADPLPPQDRSPASRHSTLERLYRENAARLTRFFARRASQDEASDLLQETFARFAVLEEPASYVQKPEAYLGTVATNLLRDRARSAARCAVNRQQPLDTDHPCGIDPHRVLEDRNTLARLEIAVQRLSSRRRQIFLLHRLEHLTYAEIASKMGMSVKGVKTQMAKALLELRRELGPL